MVDRTGKDPNQNHAVGGDADNFRNSRIRLFVPNHDESTGLEFDAWFSVITMSVRKAFGVSPVIVDPEFPTHPLRIRRGLPAWVWEGTVKAGLEAF